MDFDKLAEIISENHTETVQRLTRLETQLTGLPERVSDLEHFKYKLLGVTTAVSTIAATFGAWVFRKQ